MVKDQYEYSQCRKVVVLRPDGGTTEYKGNEVYNINALGIVFVKQSTLRHLIPWHRIAEFTYDTNDEGARKKIQGY